MATYSGIFYGFYEPQDGGWIETKCDCEQMPFLVQSLRDEYPVIESTDCFGEAMCPKCDVVIWKRELKQAKHDMNQALYRGYQPRRMDVQLSQIRLEQFLSDYHSNKEV